MISLAPAAVPTSSSPATARAASRAGRQPCNENFDTSLRASTQAAGRDPADQETPSPHDTEDAEAAEAVDIRETETAPRRDDPVAVTPLFTPETSTPRPQEASPAAVGFTFAATPAHEDPDMIAAEENQQTTTSHVVPADAPALRDTRSLSFHTALRTGAAPAPRAGDPGAPAPCNDFAAPEQEAETNEASPATGDTIVTKQPEHIATTAAQFAGHARPIIGPNPDTGTLKFKNKILSPTHEQLADGKNDAGTTDALSSAVMQSGSPASTAILAVKPATRATADTERAAPAVESTASHFALPPSTGGSALTFSSPAPAAAPTASAEAIRMIERVAELAEQASARPTGEVRVSVDLAEHGRVEVKVAIREGRIHADFRTESPELRQALAQAWQDFKRSPEAASTRWSEPVFSAASPAGAANDSAFSSFADAHSSGGRDQAPRRESAAALPQRHVSSAVSTATATVSAAPLRHDNSRHLSALA